MGAAWIVLLAAAVAAAILWRRRRLRLARERCRQQLDAFLDRHRPAMALADAAPRELGLERDGERLARVDLGRLSRAAAGRDEEARRRLFTAFADAACLTARPLSGDYELKRHGFRTLPRPAGEGLPLVAPEPKPVRFTEPTSGLSMVYKVDGEPGLTYVCEDHLHRAGIDARDLHAVALAVLRQRFDASGVRTALAEDGLGRLEPEDGCGGSLLLLLPEALEADESLFAAAPAPALLLFAVRRELLEEARASSPDLLEPLPPALFRVTAGGVSRID